MTKSKTRVIISGAVLAVFTCIAAGAFYQTNSSRKVDSWEGLDRFNASLPGMLTASNSDASKFGISALAVALGDVRIKGMAVCAQDEVTASQYIQLATISEALSHGYPNVSGQLNQLLTRDSGITDCEFRVLESATALRGKS